ncbi:uncharacterized protein LOC112032374 [Quercus suber]|uniref:uncharacterized protein LOC112032374 n=1 Tax=Quercus suber TaxID=58331 RepID=UPI0032DF3FA3
MPRIDPLVIVYSLNVNPGFSPIQQKKRVFAQEQDRAIGEEVKKLLEADFIRKVYYLDWLANMVMIGRNVQVYVNDMLVKSLHEDDHLDDLRETFDTLRSYNMKLNPSKCAFGVTAGKFLGFMVSQRGIVANPEKGQVVADFIIEFTPAEGKGAEAAKQWSIHTDGSSNKCAGGAGVVIKTPEGDRIECMIRLDFPTTNNEAKYEALVAGLDLAKVARAEDGIVHYDSQVIASQVNGSYECKNERMRRYLEGVKNRVSSLKVRVIQISREENECANCLAKATSVEFMIAPKQVLSFIQKYSLIDDGANVQEVDSESNWTTPLTGYLRSGMLSNGKDAARKLKVQASLFVLIKNVLYKKGFSQSYLRCLDHEEADYVIREVYEGICGNHSGARSLVHKLIRAGYYWPTMLKDAQAYVKTCDKCQKFSNLIRQPPEELTLMTAPGPFAQWGLDIMGPFPIAVKQLKFLVVGIDYFTKYGIPRVLVSDNGKQFDNNAFRDFCLKLARTPTGETLFRLAYGSDAIIPAEVGLTSYQVENYEDKNEKALCLQLDLVDEVWATVEQRLAQYQNLMAKYYNSNVRHKDFQVGDLVIWKVMGTARDPSQGKLDPN